MTDIEKVLNPDFLLCLVSIESIQFYAEVEDSINKRGLISSVELKVMVIEPTNQKNKLSENIYVLNLTRISVFETWFADTGERAFEFDTDEVTLKKESDSSQIYALKFLNATTNITISFSNLAIQLIHKREFIDGE